MYRYQHDAAHSGFWDLLVSSRMTLLSTAEVASANISASQAAAFISPSQDGGGAAQALGSGMEGAGMQEELDDME